MLGDHLATGRSGASRRLPGPAGRLLPGPTARGASRRTQPGALTPILAWADSHKRQTGRWPNEHSGPVCGAAGETWWNISAALADFYESCGSPEEAAQWHTLVENAEP